MTITATVYLIRHEACPSEGYIGKTIAREKRWSQHRQDASRLRTPVYEWWRQLLASTGQSPTFHVVEERTFDHRKDADAWALQREMDYIAWAKAQGVYILHNTNEGGRGGRNPLASTRAKQSAAKKGRRLGPETRARMSATRQGMKHAPGVIARIAKGLRRRGVGVTPSYGRWRADICIESRSIYLGTFDTREEAQAARTAAELKYWGPPED